MINENIVKDKKGRVMKVGVIISTKDPEGKRRFLLRHNKPFNGYEDEWTIAFGNVEKGENLIDAATREASEEYGINAFEKVHDLEYSIEYTGKYGLTAIHFILIIVKDLNVQITLNEESIGYDWKLFDEAINVMLEDDEKEAIKKAEQILAT